MNVYLITTIHNQETRWDHAKSQMLGLTHMPFLAPDYRLFQYAGLNEKQAKHQSLTMAYLQIAQSAIFAGESQYMVVEDDISFCDNFEYEIMQLLENLPKDWDFCYLTKTEHNLQCAKTTPINQYICKVVSNWWQTPITLWGSKMIDYFAEHISQKLEVELWTGNIDHELVKICESTDLNFYAAEKRIADGLSSVPDEYASSFKIGSLSA